MKVDIFAENESVLLVGEGNFSFAVSLFQLKLPINIIATCYETSVEQETGKKNIEYLVKNGVRVLMGIDATNLTNTKLGKLLFNKIIFNFPHVGGKMRIEKNRELLRQFFMSATNLMKDDGRILVTLCNGQGGTEMDNPQRRWDDSWKITEMAAYANLIIIQIVSFVWPLFEGYNVTGYRSLEKGFHTLGALTHILKKSEVPNIENISCSKEMSALSSSMTNFVWNDLKRQLFSVCNHDAQAYCYTYKFDITLYTDRGFLNSELYPILYLHAGHIIHDVEFINLYSVPHENKERRTYRITYKSSILPLYRERVICIHQNLIPDIIQKHLKVTIPN